MDFMVCKFEKVMARLDQIEMAHKKYVQQNNATIMTMETKIGKSASQMQHRNVCE